MIRPLKLIYAILFVAIIYRESSLATTLSCYDFYSRPTDRFALWLETPSEKRDQWIRTQSGATIKKLTESKNYQVTSDAVLSFNSEPFYLGYNGNSQANYALKFMGVAKPQALYRIPVDGKSSEIILTTETLTKDTSFSLLNVLATKNDKHVILVASDNGNIDVFQLYVYDLTTKKVVAHFPISGAQVSWKNDKEFFYYDASLRGVHTETGLKIYNIETGISAPVKKSEVMIVSPTSYIVSEKGSYHLHIQGEKRIFLPRSLFNTNMSIESIRTVKTDTDSETYLYTNDFSENSGKVLKYSTNQGKGRWETLYKNDKQSVIDSVNFYESYMVVNSYWGTSVRSKILNNSGKLIFDIETPECCQVSNVQFKKDSDIAIVDLSSHFKKNVATKYSLKEKRFLDPTIQKQMMSFDGVDFTSAIHWAQSKDGTRLPVRLTYRKDLPRDSNNPLLIYGYGGFGLPGYMNSFDTKMDAFFIKNGGIIAGPALRGGNEFGPQWHKSASHENKYKTMEDFAATAKMVHSLELSNRDKTAIQGWSNGGMIVAATGLLFRDVIGIVISGNGVNDLLRKEELDPLYDFGWIYEYGDSRNRKVKNYLKKWAPVYQAQLRSQTPIMLIANGRLDSRVNPAHSMKLALAMQSMSATPENIHLLSINNSGHWMTSVAYQNSIAWKSQTLIWTFIFDQMNMTPRFDGSP